MAETFISSTAHNFDQPIADMAVRLAQRSVGGVDLDYIYSAILLTVARFEAYMVRGAYLKELKPKRVVTPASLADKVDSGPPRTGREIMCTVFQGYGEKGLTQVEEAYILRDVITHNHLWEYRLREDGTRHVLHRFFGGNKNFQKHVDFEATPIKTRVLSLPIIPGDQTRASLKAVHAALAGALTFASGDVPRGEHLSGNHHVRIPKELSAHLFGPAGKISVRLDDLMAALPE